VAKKKIVDCSLCGKSSLSKDEIGLNQKMISREIKQFMCINCLSEYLECDTDFLEQKVEEFKLQGCTLF
jgi:uncharacterized protein YlaI